ncbi:hypothetical protein D3C81_1088760 [compost metagenome]
MVGTEGASGGIPQQRIVLQTRHAVVHVVDLVADSGDAAFDIGHPVVNIGHRVIGGLQLAAVHRVGAGVAQLAGGNVGDLVRAGAAVVGAEGASGGIPQQCVVAQGRDLVAQGGDIAFDVGYTAIDIGHLVTNGGHRVTQVGHRVVGGLQLAAVDRVGAGVAQFAGGNVGDLVRAGAAMVGAEGASGGIPQQRIVAQSRDLVAQGGDVAFNVGYTTIDVGHATIEVSDISFQVSHTVPDITQGFVDFAKGRADVARSTGGTVQSVGINERVARCGNRSGERIIRRAATKDRRSIAALPIDLCIRRHQLADVDCVGWRRAGSNMGHTAFTAG